jgi:hypothetical protein
MMFHVSLPPCSFLMYGFPRKSERVPNGRSTPSSDRSSLGSVLLQRSTWSHGLNIPCESNYKRCGPSFYITYR